MKAEGQRGIMVQLYTSKKTESLSFSLSSSSSSLSSVHKGAFVAHQLINKHANNTDVSIHMTVCLFFFCICVSARTLINHTLCLILTLLNDSTHWLCHSVFHEKKKIIQVWTTWEWANNDLNINHPFKTVCISFILKIRK